MTPVCHTCSAPIYPDDAEECVIAGECRHGCRECDEVAREDALIERADAARKGDW